MALGNGVFWKWLGHKGALMNEINALLPKKKKRKKKGLRELASVVPSAMWGYKKSVTQKGALTWPGWHPDFGLPDSRTMSL